jgi:bifunctional UDP-N-acetylglucosamine pyrophosphorylase/glucosamine-1-phosphate N-acetyltransferase
MRPFTAVILAAGQGKRMKSDVPKVLHRVVGKPLISWVVSAARAAGAERIVVVLGVDREKVQAILPASVETVLQDRPLGTGHAARCAAPLLKGYAGPVAVLCGDVPLLRPAMVKDLVDEQERAAAAVLTAEATGEHAYGRVLRDATGAVVRIVEHRDATPEERRIREINTGTYAFAPGVLFPALDELRNDNAQGEYYLTDVVAWLVNRGCKVSGIKAPRIDECLGINTPEELATAERIAEERGYIDG